MGLYLALCSQKKTKRMGRLVTKALRLNYFYLLIDLLSQSNFTLQGKVTPNQIFNLYTNKITFT